MPFSMTLPFSTNTLIISLLCLGIFFSLPTQDFFRGQGKIKVGTGAEIIHSIHTILYDILRITSSGWHNTAQQMGNIMPSRNIKHYVAK